MNRKQITIVLILSFLTALEPLSIDLFLPAFTQMAEQFNTSSTNVQMSLSTFLAGFAIGQLIWGPLADRYGRKKPLLISLIIFILASVACVYAQSIEQLWGMRFVQAIGGCGSIVIARVVVTDYFESHRTMSVFAILAMIMGVAPIIAPIIGNQLVKWGGWEFTFEAMAILGALSVLFTWFLLPETRRVFTASKTLSTGGQNSVWQNYIVVLQKRQFVVYALIAGVVQGALMLYIGNAPFIVMDVGGMSGDVFSIIFAVNALGMMLSAYLASRLQKRYSAQKIVGFAATLMCVFAVVYIGMLLAGASMHSLLAALFLYTFPMGMLFPATTDLAMAPFSTDNSGSASSLFGALQLGIAFLITIVGGHLSDGSLLIVGITFLVVSLLIFPILFISRTKKLNS
ncbi:multidrug effflux MFS transporter [Sphingobacterium gobiense]|nr:multidrug effflux MFS transporter [Sphingobacterium gobiense]